MEPTSVVSKAWDHVIKIGERAAWKPKTALITGAGPIGLLAAMVGLLGPLLIVGMGLIVMGIVFAMLLPIFEMNQLIH